MGGVYYSNTRIHQFYAVTDRGFADTVMKFWGVTVEQRYGMSQLGAYSGFLEAHLKDVEIAAFAEGNYWITEKLKATAGVRMSRVTLDYDQISHGVNSSRYPNSTGAFVQGASANSPFTPKIGLTYEFTPNDLVYANAAKGFRAGGVNSPIGQTICDTGLTQFGITANDIPPAYGPDTVWSYEAGGKFRLLDNKLQLNGAAYRIDWSGIQSTFTVPGCAQTFVQNGAKARSEGVDLQAQFRPVRPLTIGMNLGYTNARYLEAVAGPRGNVPGVPPSINKGDHFAVPKWQLSMSAQLDFTLASLNMYVRGDYQWQSKYTGPGTFGVASYNPFTLNVPSRDQLNARLGVTFDRLDVNVFAFNVLDSKDQIGNSGNGISGCAATSQNCSVFTLYQPFVNQGVVRPREVGVQANYRF